MYSKQIKLLFSITFGKYTSNFRLDSGFIAREFLWISEMLKESFIFIAVSFFFYIEIQSELNSNVLH